MPTSLSWCKAAAWASFSTLIIYIISYIILATSTWCQSCAAINWATMNVASMLTSNNNKHMCFDTSINYKIPLHAALCDHRSSIWERSVVQQDHFAARKIEQDSFLVVTEHWQPEQRPRPRVRQSWPSWSFLRLPSASTVFNLVSPSLSLIFFTITYVLITVRLFGLALTYF